MHQMHINPNEINLDTESCRLQSHGEGPGDKGTGETRNEGRYNLEAKAPGAQLEPSDGDGDDDGGDFRPRQWRPVAQQT